MKRQPIFNKLILQGVFNCHYMQPTQIRIELFLRSTCRHLFYYGGLLPYNSCTAVQNFKKIEMPEQTTMHPISLKLMSATAQANNFRKDWEELCG